jgi:transcriptional regulator with XRE-family HTH domain
MALTIGQRKDRLPYRAQQEIANEMGVDKKLVSAVMNDKAVGYAAPRVRAVQEMLAARMGLTAQYVFGAALAKPAESQTFQEVG